MMSESAITAWIAGAFSLLSVSVSVFISHFMQRKTLKHETEKIIEERSIINFEHYEPLINAAYELQSRIYNIKCNNFTHYLMNGTERDKEYFIYSTAYIFIQYFAYSELFLSNIKNTFFFQDEKINKITLIQDDITRLFSSDNHTLEKEFRIFSVEKRSLGFYLIIERKYILQYNDFIEKFKSSPIDLVNYLIDDVQSLQYFDRAPLVRLTRIQHKLVELINSVDPKCRRFPEGIRRKIPI